MTVICRICTACLTKGAAPLIAQLRTEITARHIDAVLDAMDCGDTCTRPARLWLQSETGAAYVFEDLDLDTDRDDILATLTTYLASPKGWIEDARPCGRLRFCLTARVPH